MGLSWWSSGSDSELPLQGVRVRSPVGELGSRNEQSYYPGLLAGQSKQGVFGCQHLGLIFNWLGSGWGAWLWYILHLPQITLLGVMVPATLVRCSLKGTEPFWSKLYQYSLLGYLCVGPLLLL